MIRVLAIALLVTGCAPKMANFPSMPQPIEISYEAGPCFGTCPMYRVTVNNLGQPGVFEGVRFTAVEGRREFPLTYAQFEAFYRAVSDARAASAKDYEAGGPNCRQYATDHPGVTLTFREGNDEPWTFRFDYGCRDAGNAKLAADLRRAPALLPIAPWIGTR